MRKRIFGRKLNRNTNQRKALFRSLMGSLVLYGKIKTTEAKAKSIKGELEKLVTLAKNKGADAKNLLVSRLVNTQVVEKVISEIAPKFATRPGGYIRIVRMGKRVKDGAKMVLMSWVEEIAPTSFKQPKRKVSRISRGKDKSSSQTKKSGGAAQKGSALEGKK